MGYSILAILKKHLDCNINSRWLQSFKNHEYTKRKCRMFSGNINISKKQNSNSQLLINETRSKF